MDIEKVFDRFCKKLQKRTRIMTEDNIRYYWFASMQQQDHNLNNYTLEYPYSQLNLGAAHILQKEELDLLYNNNSTDFFCFEMKFHRNATQSSSSAKTSAAGDIFNDLQRLQQIANPGARRFFLYVTDPIMYKYLSKRNGKDRTYSNLLMNFCTLNSGGFTTLNFTSAPNTPPTFKKQANGLPVIQTLRLLYKDDFSCNNSSFANNNNNNNNCHVRLYEVL